MAHFETEVCQNCPFSPKCPAQRGKRDLRWHLRFTQAQANVSKRRRRSLAYQKEDQNLRAAVEATVRQVKHPFPASKLPVRGRFRVTCMVIGSAVVSNVRRIQRYLEEKIKQENEQKLAERAQKCPQDQLSDSFFPSLITTFREWMLVVLLHKTSLQC